jgi:hypothetical protein
VPSFNSAFSLGLDFGDSGFLDTRIKKKRKEKSSLRLLGKK